jgi:hypothetical protein
MYHAVIARRETRHQSRVLEVIEILFANQAAFLAIA